MLEMIVKWVYEALHKGLDPVEHVRARLQAHPAIPDEWVGDMDKVLGEIEADFPDMVSER